MEKCLEIEFSYKEEISADMVCARSLFDGAMSGGTCQGDSGGPFTVKNRRGQHHLVGVTSWGGGCAQVRF